MDCGQDRNPAADAGFEQELHLILCGSSLQLLIIRGDCGFICSDDMFSVFHRLQHECGRRLDAAHGFNDNIDGRVLEDIIRILCGKMRRDSFTMFADQSLDNIDGNTGPLGN